MIKSEIQYNGYQVNEVSFKVDNNINEESQLRVDFNVQGILRKKGEFALRFETKISNDENSLNIEIGTTGYFTFNNQLAEDESLHQMLALNAPAILFPYIRSYISILSVQSGLNPIVLPTLNLSGHKDEILRNLEIIE